MGAKSKPTEFLTEERCWITELFNDSALESVSVARARVEPGVTTQLHALSVAEWYVIETGEGRMRVGDRAPVDVAAGDTVQIPTDYAQQITNTGEVDLLFLCVCVPRFSPACYSSLE